jgi:hypothetical protein
MNFKKWLIEVGMGGGGPGGGMEPPSQNPSAIQGAFADYHTDDDLKNPNDQLPVLSRKKRIKKKWVN